MKKKFTRLHCKEIWFSSQKLIKIKENNPLSSQQLPSNPPELFAAFTDRLGIQRW